ncbi:7-carboxy-7-deazaguanine synthase QueE [Sphingobacteriales bacterium UPWRP_1]|nr:7-carboxy-7-deazaguanine synthase QueE [Sphingobacteriales bacterium TSM_CSS]PSJ77662.1 7-carboxy-7-deazaguanine synthase QueE [Sphingobacteriales bacterium UPWRP_1]
MEQFYTIQGEGAYQGSAAVFIRLGGCDVGCVWCDVKESWNAGNHPQTDITDIIRESGKYESEICVITGGEPLMHNLTALCTGLQKAGKRTHVETSGAHPLTGKWDWICLSPKKFKFPLPEVVAVANELKVVVYHPSDFAWAEQFAAKVPANCQLFLQPEWSKTNTILPLIVDYVKQHPKWQISLQIHKYMNIP